MKKIILAVIVILFLIVGFTVLSHNGMKKIEIGDKIPSFSLKDQNGKEVSIYPEMNKPLVIYFYPKDDTPGCTKEACSFRDSYQKFVDLGVTVIGISTDSVESHKKFEEKYKLPFTLLADTNNEVRNAFGVPKTLMLIPGRVTYIVDKKGTVQFIFNSQFNAEKHIQVALEKLKGL